MTPLFMGRVFSFASFQESSMSRVWPTILLLCIAASAAGADKTKSGPSPRERLDAIKKEYKAAEDAFSKARDALPDTPEGNKKKQELYEAYDKDRSDRFMAAVELARCDPKSEVGFAALEWVLTIPRSFYLSAGKPAMQLMTEHHATNPKIGKVVAWVG